VTNEGFQGTSLKPLEGVSEPEAIATTPQSGANCEHPRLETGKDRPPQAEDGKNFLTWLDTEIAAFEGLVELDRAAEAELSGYAFDARLLLPDKELEKIRRYQADTQREFDNAFKRLLEWRKTRAELEAQRHQQQGGRR